MKVMFSVGWLLRLGDGALSSAQGHTVAIVDNFVRRQVGITNWAPRTLTPILPLSDRLRTWARFSGKTIGLLSGM